MGQMWGADWGADSATAIRSGSAIAEESETSVDDKDVKVILQVSALCLSNRAGKVR
jgi:hypothetical protein